MRFHLRGSRNRAQNQSKPYCRPVWTILGKFSKPYSICTQTRYVAFPWPWGSQENSLKIGTFPFSNRTENRTRTALQESPHHPLPWASWPDRNTPPLSRDRSSNTPVALCFLWYRRLSLLHPHFFPYWKWPIAIQRQALEWGYRRRSKPIAL